MSVFHEVTLLLSQHARDRKKLLQGTWAWLWLIDGSINDTCRIISGRQWLFTCKNLSEGPVCHHIVSCLGESINKGLYAH